MFLIKSHKDLTQFWEKLHFVSRIKQTFCKLGLLVLVGSVKFIKYYILKYRWKKHAWIGTSSWKIILHISLSQVTFNLNLYTSEIV